MGLTDRTMRLYVYTKPEMNEGTVHLGVVVQFLKVCSLEPLELHYTIYIVEEKEAK